MDSRQIFLFLVYNNMVHRLTVFGLVFFRAVIKRIAPTSSRLRLCWHLHNPTFHVMLILALNLSMFFFTCDSGSSSRPPNWFSHRLHLPPDSVGCIESMNDKAYFFQVTVQYLLRISVRSEYGFTVVSILGSSLSFHLLLSLTYRFDDGNLLHLQDLFTSTKSFQVWQHE